jgi:tRNA (guanine-N7-)-methyltransferase
MTEHEARLDQRRALLRDSIPKLLSGHRSFVWEVGCGHGHFLSAYAAERKDLEFIGIDIIRERIARADRKREQAQLGNLHFIHANARDFLETMPADACISAAYILFPDPWPKRRHHKNRLLEPNFLHALARRVGQGTRLYFRTDFEPYFAEAAETIAAQPDWKLLPGAPWPFEEPTVFQKKADRYHSLVAERA